MIRYDCLELLAPRITNNLVVTSLSGQKIEWANLSQHPGNLLVGTMGTALGVGHWFAATEGDRFGIGRQPVAVALQSADPGQFGCQKFEGVCF